jgi:type III restriction enzyme
MRGRCKTPLRRLSHHKADIAIITSGVEATEREGAITVALDEADIQLPDLLTDLQDRTQLTRRTIYRILVGSERLNDFKRHPQQFIELAAEAINRRKCSAVVDSIKYRRLGDEYYYTQELFEQEELTGYLKNMLAAEKSVYEQVVYDSATEATFAEDLENNALVKVYANLPGWFTVPTPLGSYSADWGPRSEGSRRAPLLRR